MRYYLLDRITELRPPEFARGRKAFTLSEDFFADHFPSYPTAPGALLVESLAQLSGVLLERSAEKALGVSIQAVLSVVERAKFRVLVRPGDVLEIEARVTQLRQEGGKVSTFGRVGERVAVSADLLFAFFKLEDEAVRAEQARLVAYWLDPNALGKRL